MGMKISVRNMERRKIAKAMEEYLTQYTRLSSANSAVNTVAMDDEDVRPVPCATMTVGLNVPNRAAQKMAYLKTARKTCAYGLNVVWAEFIIRKWATNTLE